MGLINNNTMETNNGLIVPVGAYMCIGTDSMETSVKAGTYTLQFVNTVWKDKATRDANTRSIQAKSYTLALTEAQLSASVYTLAYNHLRTVYTNTTDE